MGTDKTEEPTECPWDHEALWRRTQDHDLAGRPPPESWWNQWVPTSTLAVWRSEWTAVDYTSSNCFIISFLLSS